jgi:hypothetical protein
VFDFFARWFGRLTPRAATRLSEQEALAIARDATTDDPLCGQLAMTLVEQRPEGPVWIVGSAAIGLSLEVTIDDASGRVLAIKHVGLR